LRTITFSHPPRPKLMTHPGERLGARAPSREGLVFDDLALQTSRMTTAFVTGATGFLGLNLVDRLVRDGWDVTALHRASSDLTYLQRFAPGLAVGDVVEADSVLAAMPKDVDAVFHLAASTNFWAVNNSEQTRINVAGTRNVVRAALERGAKRFVYTSSIAAYAPQSGTVLREDTPSRAADHWINYFRTKWLAEQEVRAGIEKGLDAVILNPGNILGPYELHNWSKLFVLVKAGKLPGVFPGAAGWCHVKSVVDAQVAAAQRGRKGENYLLGSVHASYLELTKLVVELTGGKAPSKATPEALLRAIARLTYWGSLITRKEPDITPEVVDLGVLDFACDCSKAENELGYREVSLEEMAQDTYNWMVSEGKL
jgi:dihydroflavonol-4-reductase